MVRGQRGERGGSRVRADRAQERIRGDGGDLDAGAGPGRLHHQTVAHVHRHMGGLGEVDHQVAGAQRGQRDVRQLGPLLLAGARDGAAGVRPRLRGEPGAVVGLRPLRAPHVRFADLVDRVRERPVALRRGGPGAAEGARGQQVLLGTVGAPLFETGQFGQLLGGEVGEELLDLLEALLHVVLLPLLPLGERLLLVERPARGAREVGGLPLAPGEPVDGGLAFAGRAGQDVALVERALRVFGEQHPHVRGEIAAALVLLAGEAAGGAPAPRERGARGGERCGDPLVLGLAALQLDVGGLVRLGRLLRLPVQRLEPAQQGRGGGPGGLFGLFGKGGRGLAGRPGRGRRERGHRRRRQGHGDGRRVHRAHAS